MKQLVKYAVLIAALGSGLATGSPIVNGGFETGDLDGWDRTGPASFTNAPVFSGAKSAFILAPNGGADNASDIATFVGVSQDALVAIRAPGGTSPLTTGSAIRQIFTANAGDTITFKWKFATDEGIPSQWDFSFYVIDGVAFRLGDTSDTSLAFTGDATGTGLGSATDWLDGSFVIGSTGSHTLSFGALQAGDFSVTSALFVDNVSGGSRIVDVPGTRHPRASRSGLAGLGFSRRKKA